VNPAIFKSYDIRGKVGTELTEETSGQIARAFADWLPRQGVVAVGHDMRPDSASLAKAFIEGLRQQGRDVWDIGMVTSDMIYFAIGKFDLAGGAVITASHNPGADNGIKLYRDHVTPVGLDSGLDAIRDAAMAATFREAAATPGGVTKRDITEDWVAHCLSFVRELRPYHIAIDAGNGMAGAILPHILPKLPLKVESMYFEPDGTFPNHEANPQKPENLQDLIRQVQTGKLDFGIAFDGDGDRAGIVDDKGRMVLADSGLITALVAMQAISDSGKKVSELVDEYRLYVMGPEINFEVSDPQGAFARLREAFKDGDQSELDGLTVDYPDKWFNVRASNTEPVMRLNAEAKTQADLDELVAKVKAILLA
jgi:phosphomannomutase